MLLPMAVAFGCGAYGAKPNTESSVSAAFQISSASQNTQAREVRRPPPSAAEPAAAAELQSALAQTAAIVEGTVSGIFSEYTEESGPWTRYEFSDVVAHRGKADIGRLTFVQRGGELPDGSILMLSTNHDFVPGARYLVFLRNTNWNLSPVVGEYCFRIEAIQGRQMLISRDGSAVVGLHAEGLVRSASLFGPRDLNGDAPVRKASAPLPSQVLSVQDFLKAIDSNLVAVGRNSLRGEFYNEPRVRQGFLAQLGTHSGSELPQRAVTVDVPDNTQLTYDARPAWENVE